jgi:class 3 adenylate cyclase/pimeloyl-ACP methyl ester carboxylesterase
MFPGGGGLPLVFFYSWGTSLEINFQSDEWMGFIEELARDRPIVQWDARGCGASQRELDHANHRLDSLVEDLAAVVEHLGLREFHLFSHSAACAPGVAYTVSHPDRIASLVFWAPFAANTDRASAEAMNSLTQLVRGNWPMARRAIADFAFPDGPIEMQRYVSRYYRESVTSQVAAQNLEYEATLDMTDILPQVLAPTLVLHRRGDRNVPVSAGRKVAALMPNARFVPLEGGVGFTGWDAGSYVGLIREFLAEHETSNVAPPLPSGMTAILFLDIAGSTELTTKLGDAAYREKERQLDSALREAIREAGGAPVDGKVLGDGVMATFASAKDAIDAALRCQSLGEDAGLSLHAGIHAGDVTREGDNVHGGAVQVAARIADASAAGEVLVSDVVRGLARTSAGVSFEDRGERDLKGVSEPVRVFAVRN